MAQKMIFYGWLDITQDPPYLTFIFSSPAMVMMAFGSWDALDQQIETGKGKLVRLALSVDSEMSVDEAMRLCSPKRKKK